MSDGDKCSGKSNVGVHWKILSPLGLKLHNEMLETGTSLVAQWVRLCARNAGGPGSIPDRGTRFHMHATTKRSHATTKELVCCN